MQNQEAYLSHAGADPGAMVVKFPHAIVTDCAVRAAGWSIMIARGTPLGVDCVTVHLIFLC